MTPHYPSTFTANKRKGKKVWNFEKGRERAIAAARFNGSKGTWRKPPPITLPRVKFLEAPDVD